MGGSRHFSNWMTVILDGDAQLLFLDMGASTVKWTSLDPCSSLKEIDPKLYSNFEFYEIKIQKYLENI